MVNFVAHYRGVDPVDLIQDGWSLLTHGMQRRAKPDMTPEEIADLMQMVDFEVMEDVRKRAETWCATRRPPRALKPWYNWLCKRPCFHDEYLDVFNQDNVTLVDTEGRGLDRIDGNVVVANGEEFELDLLIFATGFELSPYEEGSPLPVTGRDGRRWPRSGRRGPPPCTASTCTASRTCCCRRPARPRGRTTSPSRRMSWRPTSPS